jgi:hypothetical protein
LLIEKLAAEATGVFNQQSTVKNQQLLPACEEAIDRRQGRSSLPPAALKMKEKRRTPCLV